LQRKNLKNGDAMEDKRRTMEREGEIIKANNRNI
jgi:hypothetical protein